MSKMMRIDDVTHEHLERLAEQTGESKVDLLRKAVFMLERQAFFERMNEQLELLADNKVPTADVAWDVTLREGLEEEDFSIFEEGVADDSKKTASR